MDIQKQCLPQRSWLSCQFWAQSMVYCGGPPHRAMSREGQGYLQQMCGYLRRDGMDVQGAGRIFPVNEGIMGAAYETGQVWRTRSYADLRWTPFVGPL